MGVVQVQEQDGVLGQTVKRGVICPLFFTFTSFHSNGKVAGKEGEEG